MTTTSSSSSRLIIPVVIFSAIVVGATTTTQATQAFQTGLDKDAQKGFDKFVHDWKAVCPDSKNWTSFCNGYLTGASIRSSGPG